MSKYEIETPRKLELVSLIDVIFLLLIFFLVVTSVTPLTKRAQRQIVVPQEPLLKCEPATHTTYDAIFLMCNNGVKVISRRNYNQVFYNGITHLQSVSLTIARGYIQNCLTGNRFLIRARANIPWRQVLDLYNSILNRAHVGVRVDFEVIGAACGSLAPPVAAAQIVYGQ